MCPVLRIPTELQSGLLGNSTVDAFVDGFKMQFLPLYPSPPYGAHLIGNKSQLKSVGFNSEQMSIGSAALEGGDYSLFLL